MNKFRSQFPILKTKLNGHDLIYLDSAATSQKPQEVIDAMTDFYTNYNASSHSVHSLGSKVTEMMEQTRQVVADFIGCKYEEVVFTAGATEGINLIANGFLEASLDYRCKFGLESKKVEASKNTPSGFACHPSRGELNHLSFLNSDRFCLSSDSEILICVDQHHSNILPWQRLAQLIGCKVVFFGVLADGRWDTLDFESKLNMNTKLIAISNVSNVFGVVQDVEKLNEILKLKYKTELIPVSLDVTSPLVKGNSPTKTIIRNLGSQKPIVVLDATQAVSHFDVDVKKLDVDFMVFSGHKIYGPTGVGVLYGRRQLLEVLPSYKVGGDMVESVTAQCNIYKESPFRFEAGTANFGSIIGLKAAIKWFIRSRDEILQTESGLLNYLLKKLKEIEGLKFLSEIKITQYPAVLQQPLDRDNLDRTQSYLSIESFNKLKLTNNGKNMLRIPIVSFNISLVNSLDLALLLDQKGICIRSGQHCTGILHQFLNIDSSCRISLACFNTFEEIDFAIKCLKDAIKILN